MRTPRAAARAAATASWLAALATAGLLVAPPGETVGLVAIMGGAWLAGRLLRQRGEEAAALFRDEAERAERESAERARTAVAEERAHIARELHDIVAHSISVMVLQTGAGRQVMDRDPDKAREMLSSVERSGREAMDEMQRLVGIMRAREGMLDYRPQPGLAELDELVKGSEGAGLAVRVNRNGDPNGISPGVDLAAYRIVQEALTNAIKHADASEVELSLDYRAGRLEICVRDDGVGANGSPTGQGHGLVGMRERAALYGGQLHAGAREGSGSRCGWRYRPGNRGVSIRTMIVDDQALARTGLQTVLGIDPEIDVVGEAADGRQAVDRARRLKPDVMLMDVRMPKLDGIAATREITNDALTRNVKVIVLTTFDVDEYVFGALEAGASGFLLKDTPVEQITNAVRTVHSGHALLAPGATKHLVESVLARRHRRDPPEGFDELTPREHEILMEIARGRSNAEIAEKFVLGEATVKTHVSRVRAKLNLRDRVHAVVMAYECGLIEPGEAAAPDRS